MTKKDTRSQPLDEETLVEEFLLGRVAREIVLETLGPERLAEIEYQKNVLQREVEWSLLGAPASSRPWAAKMAALPAKRNTPRST